MSTVEPAENFHKIVVFISFIIFGFVVVFFYLKTDKSLIPHFRPLCKFCIARSRFCVDMHIIGLLDTNAMS